MSTGSGGGQFDVVARHGFKLIVLRRDRRGSRVDSRHSRWSFREHVRAARLIMLHVKAGQSGALRRFVRAPNFAH